MHNDHEPLVPHSPAVGDEHTAAAYRFGFNAGRDRRHEAFEAAEVELRASWLQSVTPDTGSWEKHRDLIREGFACARQGPAEDSPVADHGGKGVEPLHADPATKAANRVHDHVAQRRGL